MAIGIAKKKYQLMKTPVQMVETTTNPTYRSIRLRAETVQRIWDRQPIRRPGQHPSETVTLTGFIEQLLDLYDESQRESRKRA